MHCDNKRASYRKEQLKLKKTYKATFNAYGAGVWYSNKKDRYIRYSCNDKRLRQSMNRMIRRKLNREIQEDESSMPVGYYRKMADYWWTLL